MAPERTKSLLRWVVRCHELSSALGQAELASNIRPFHAYCAFIFLTTVLDRAGKERHEYYSPLNQG